MHLILNTTVRCRQKGRAFSLTFRLLNVGIYCSHNDALNINTIFILDFQAGKALLQKSMESSQNNLREMVKLRQETVS